MAVLDYIPVYTRFEVRPHTNDNPNEFLIRFWTASKSAGAPVEVWFDVATLEADTADPAVRQTQLLEELETAWTDQGFAWTF